MTPQLVYRLDDLDHHVCIALLARENGDRSRENQARRSSSEVAADLLALEKGGHFLRERVRLLMRRLY